MDREKVIKGLQEIVDDKWMKNHADWYVSVCADAIALLKEQEDLGTELTNAVELIHKKNERIEKLLKEQKHKDRMYHALEDDWKRLKELLKEQEAKYPVCEKCGKEIDHINTSVFSYDGSVSDYSIPITYSKENGCVSFSTSQKWTGYDLTDKEQKEGIR